MPINSSNFGEALWPGISTWYGKEYNEFKVEYTDIFTTKKSSKAWEEAVGVSGLGLAVQRGEGAAVTYDQEQQGFKDRYTHSEWALGFIITKIMVEDDQYEIAGERKSRGLAFTARQTKEVNAANFLNRAFNSSYTFGDGLCLLNTAHLKVNGGTYSNKMTTDADLSEAALEQAIIDLGKYTNDRGLRIAVRPKKLIIPVDLMFEADKIMQTQYEVGTNNNTVNVVRSKFPGGAVVNHYLTDTDAWFIVTDVPNGLTYYERRADTFTQDDDFDTDNAKFKFTSRYSFGCPDKMAIYGSQGA